jgi:hypothetical protein
MQIKIKKYILRLTKNKKKRVLISAFGCVGLRLVNGSVLNAVKRI